MIRRWIVTEPRGIRKGCLLTLPGRGVSAEMMDKFCERMELDQSLRICLEPDGLEWYPSPNGVNDQQEAVVGCFEASNVLSDIVSRIQTMWKLRRSDIALAGYSAGAVMCLKLCTDSAKPFAGCFAIAGAILDTASVKKARHKTPILLRHNTDDECFKWYERYVPMRAALVDNGYNVSTSEDNVGGHGVCLEDAHLAGDFLAESLGYDMGEREYDDDED